MPIHLYFMPATTQTEGGKSFRAPKYMSSDHRWSAIYYGMINVCLDAIDTNLVDHQTLFDTSDVLSVDPRTGDYIDLDGNATAGEITALKNYLDTAGNFCPMDWATTADTRRSIIRGVCGMFLFIQRVTALSNFVPPTQWGITMSTQWVSLATNRRDAMRQAAKDLGFVAADPANTTTMRQILRYFGSHWTAPISFKLFRPEAEIVV